MQGTNREIPVVSICTSKSMLRLATQITPLLIIIVVVTDDNAVTEINNSISFCLVMNLYLECFSNARYDPAPKITTKGVSNVVNVILNKVTSTHFTKTSNHETVCVKEV